MTDRFWNKHPHRVRAVIGVVGAFLVAAITLFWSWNTIAVELFGAPEFAFRHAVAAVLGVAVLALASGFRPRRRHPDE